MQQTLSGRWIFFFTNLSREAQIRKACQPSDEELEVVNRESEGGSNRCADRDSSEGTEENQKSRTQDVRSGEGENVRNSRDIALCHR